jgi:muramoyltetrapeptide carboxypeptidase
VAHGARTVHGGVARGRLAGGNLALLAALIGTRYAPDLNRAILVLEDVNEPLYRIDRMLRQLLLSGALADVAGLAVGSCTSSEDDAAEPASTLGPTLDTLLREIATQLNLPCVAGLPIGHIPEQWTIPLGALAMLDADALTLTVGDEG